MPTELDVLPRSLLAKLPPDDDAPGCGPCSWLGPDKACQHYTHRPEVCRQFEMGGEDCLEIRRNAGLHPQLPTR